MTMNVLKTSCLALLAAAGAASAQVDTQATLETVNLYNSMKGHAASSLMYGQHAAFHDGTYADGLGFMSDCKHISGENPAVAGFDFIRSHMWSPTGTGNDFHQQAVNFYKRGGVSTFSWHSTNPDPDHTGDGKYNDTSGDPVRGILDPTSQTHTNFNLMLDDIASFFNNLQVDGVHVPIIWRPFHENTGSWFWWGTDNCTPEEYIDLWEYTYHYLTDTCGVHNLLWAYSPSKPTSVSEYLERYPGDAYVDVLGFDRYGDADGEADFFDNMLLGAQTVASMALARGKLSAITEAGERDGFANTAITNWITRAWLDDIKTDPVAKHISYVSTWRSPDWSAFQEGPNAHLYDDFMRFYNDSFTVFEDGLPELYGHFMERYEAEDAALTEVETNNNRAGYSGMGHTTRDSFDATGDQIEFSVNVPADGNYSLAIRYNAGGNKPNYIDVNGSQVDEPTFPATGNEWETFSFGDVALTSGVNTIAIRKSWGWMDVDYIQLRGAGAVESTNGFDVVFPQTDVVTFIEVSGLPEIYYHTRHNGTNTLVNFYDARSNRTALTALIDIEVPASGEYELQWWNAETARVLSTGTATSEADGGGWKLPVMSESFEYDLILSATRVGDVPGPPGTTVVVDYQFNDAAGTQLTQLQNDGAAGVFDLNATDMLEATGDGFLKWQNTTANDGSWRIIELGGSTLTEGTAIMEWRLDSWDMSGGLPRNTGIKMVLGDSNSGQENRTVFEVDNPPDSIKFRMRDHTPSNKSLFNVDLVHTNGEGYVFRIINNLDDGTAVFEYRTDSGSWTDLTPSGGDGLSRISWIGVQMTKGWTNNPSAYALVDYLTITHETTYPDPYAAWLAGYPGLGSQTNKTDNPDGDTLNNLYEYAFGGDPTVADAGHESAYHLMEEGGIDYMEYIHVQRNDDAELTYYLETNTNLLFAASWTSAYYEVVGTNTSYGAEGFDAVTNRISTSTETNRFIRLRIEL
jgi:mannan endo-1,4-beta-mannosidase